MIKVLHVHANESVTFWQKLLDDVLLHAALDTLKIIPFLFLTYLLMEIIEHKASGKTRAFMEKSGAAGPFAGGVLGAIPQCGFSTVAANLYSGRVITLGTLIAVFLSTSDEMLPILISGDVKISTLLFILGYKALVGIIIGFSIDLIIRFSGNKKETIDIDRICENDNCHCEKGVLFSAFNHTAKISIFILIITLVLNALVTFLGSSALSAIMYDKPFISHLIAAVVGLIPNCAVSVLLTKFCIEGIITAGTMMAGLFSGAGVGLLVLFKVNKNLKENIIITGLLIAAGCLFGLIADAIGFSAII